MNTVGGVGNLNYHNGLNFGDTAKGLGESRGCLETAGAAPPSNFVLMSIVLCFHAVEFDAPVTVTVLGSKYPPFHPVRQGESRFHEDVHNITAGPQTALGSPVEP